MQVDPIVIIACALVIATILFSAASHKLRAPVRFATQLEDYQLLPHPLLLRVMARLLPLVEAGLVLALLLPASRTAAALGAAALLALYAVAMGLNLWRGRRDIDCGCAGPGQTQPLRPHLLLRNGLLVLLALLASMAPQNRELGAFDAFVTVAAGAVALLLYAAADGLLANGPRLLKLIGR